MALLFSYSHLIFLSSFLLIHTYCIIAEDPSWKFCNDNKKINNTQMSSNINQILPKLVTQTSLNGYTTLSYGTGTNTIYGLAQCRGDVLNTNECSNCIKEASIQIQKLCPNQADSRIVFEFCLLRYDSHDFIGELDNSNGIVYYNVQNVESDYKVFEKELGSLMDKITQEALDSEIRFGKGNTKLSPFITLYALVQCSRDLSKLSCAQCLAIGIGNFGGACKDKKGCRSIYSSCYVRYELYPIFYPALLNNTVADNTYSRFVLRP